MYWQAHPARDRRWFDSTYVTSGFKTVYKGDEIMCEDTVECECCCYEEEEDNTAMTHSEKNIVLFALLVLLGIVFVVNNPHAGH